jgi:pilus assembly protein CpaB
LIEPNYLCSRACISQVLFYFARSLILTTNLKMVRHFRKENFLELCSPALKLQPLYVEDLFTSQVRFRRYITHSRVHRFAAVVRGATPVNRKKSTGIIASAVLAIFGMLLMVMFVKGRSNKAADVAKAAAAPTVPMTDVWVASVDIPKGVSGDSILTLLKKEQRPTDQVPAGADANNTFKIDNIKGKWTNTPILKTNVIMDSLFESTADATAAALPPGKLAVTLILPGDHMAGVGRLTNETVGVVGSFGGTENGNVTHLVLQKVQIIGRPTPYGGVAPATVPGQPDTGPTSFVGQVQVTLAVDAPDAERLIFMSQFGILHLIQEPLTSKEDGTKIVGLDNIYQATSGTNAVTGPSTTVAGAKPGTPGVTVVGATPVAGAAPAPGATPAPKPAAVAPTTLVAAAPVAPTTLKK